ncbi:hypothetical protein PENNAL_c0036G11945 [Penicillium nalgiovense]|uniref:Uncharacterized protein n=1 Tax=Penicillium nalgiovense TaxID=60175 RepID=A0A1V6Y530_PENNA|nr:hypothetical protein PENNAL_c0036G11945 [Penicillium nalgiovense]
MGNICSRSSNETDPFNQPGRVVGTSSGGTAAPRAPLPAKTNWKATPGRTLGESTADGSTGGMDEARANAAIAAQKRAESASANKGKLGTKLAAQKAQTQSQTLDQVSRTERAARDVDGVEAARRWE